MKLTNFKKIISLAQMFAKNTLGDDTFNKYLAKKLKKIG